MIDELIKKLKEWSAKQPNIRGILIVGSHARGAARPDSDVDIVMICADPQKYLEDKAWLADFGEVRSAALEDWGLVQSWRVFYTNGLEIEFGITTDRWCAPEEILLGTGEVIRGGAKIVYDPHFLLQELVTAVQQTS
jgi:uncharacterized protein